MAVGPGPVLKEIHHLRRHIHDLETRITQAPRLLLGQKAKLKLAEDNLRSAQDEIKQLKVKINDREGSIKSTFQQITKWDKQRETVDNKKEMDALNTETTHAKQRVDAFENEIYESMTLIEEKTALLPGIEKITQQVRAEAATFEKDFDDRVARLNQEKAKAQAELAEVEKQVPEDILPIYTKLVSNRGADSLAQIEGRICTACYTEIPPQLSMEIKRGIFVTCKSCGRMLYD